MPLTHLGTDRPGRVPYEISWWQLCMIVVSAHASVVVSYAPMVSSRIPPVRDAWLASLVAWVPGLVLALIAWWLAKRFEGQNVFEFAFSIFGRSLGAVINAGLVVYLLYWAAVVTREFSLFMASIVYLRTPEVVFSVVFLILAFVGASQQIEFIGRTAELGGPLTIGGFALLLLANVPNMDFGMVRPMLAEGWRAVAEQAVGPAVVIGDTAWVALLAAPYLNNLAHGPKALGLGIGITVFFLSAGALVLMAVFGPELLAILAFPALSATRLVRIGESLERLEWLMLMLWIGAIGVKISLLLFGARLGVTSLFPGARPGAVLLAVAVVVLVWSSVVLPTMPLVLDLFLAENLVRFIVPLQLVPLVFAAAALARGVKGSG